MGRQMVLEETRYEEEMRKEELLAQQEAMDENLRRIEAGRARERALKKEVKMLNMQMKQDTVQRKKAGVDAKMQREKIQAAMEKVKQTKKWHKAGAIMKKALNTNSGSKSMKPSQRSKRSVMPSITTEEDALPPMMQPTSDDAATSADPQPYKSPYDGQ